MKQFAHKRFETGFAIISAIVLLVILAALGVAITVVSTTEQVGSAMDVQGNRAYQAARSGIEWGAYEVWNSTSAPQTRTNSKCPTSPASFTPAAPTLSAFTVTVQCTATTDGTNGGPTIFTIISTACNMPVAGACPGTANIGSMNYVERRVTVNL